MQTVDGACASRWSSVSVVPHRQRNPDVTLDWLSIAAVRRILTEAAPTWQTWSPPTLLTPTEKHPAPPEPRSGDDPRTPVSPTGCTRPSTTSPPLASAHQLPNAVAAVSSCRWL